MSFKIAITGTNGLLGRHAAIHLYAQNCAANFAGNLEPFDLVLLDRDTFNDNDLLISKLNKVNAVLHFAGVNRADESILEMANVNIAKRLVWGCKRAQIEPHIIYANSIHASSDSLYGNSKRLAHEFFENSGLKYTNLILPHIFGEGAKPDYNNVTATLINNLLNDKPSEINPDGMVSLLHAGDAVKAAIKSAQNGITDNIAPDGKPLKIQELYQRLLGFHNLYNENIFPNLNEKFDIALFNTYRSVTYPSGWPRSLHLHSDQRGTLFEAVKVVGGSGQTFASTTQPGVTRGDHFHINKVERFLVLQGKASIKIRPVLGKKISEFNVSGDLPSLVDIPTLHSHTIKNTGNCPLITLFWTNELFDPQLPDTYADKVII